MTGYEAFSIYNALKLHFSQQSYDYFKYNGKSRISIDSFENRKDKYHFYKLSRKYKEDEYINFLVANFIVNEKTWAGDLLKTEAEVNYLRRMKYMQSMTYSFENDCNLVFEELDDPNEVLRVEDGEYPVLLLMALRKEIQPETLVILNALLNFFPAWSKNVADTIRWPDYRMKMLKYTAFVPFDSVKYRLMLKKVIEQ
mgnify:CR=1 FL=1|tara:strand:- start:2778 stop:3371 length:594 start_codon:yes stop_codon:yes gene_type:complete